MAFDARLDLDSFGRNKSAHDHSGKIIRQQISAAGISAEAMLNYAVRFTDHHPAMTFMLRFSAARLRSFTTLFAVVYWRPRGRWICLLPTHLQHNLDQFVLGQQMQITSIYQAIDSAI